MQFGQRILLKVAWHKDSKLRLLEMSNGYHRYVIRRLVASEYGFSLLLYSTLVFIYSVNFAPVCLNEELRTQFYTVKQIWQLKFIQSSFSTTEIYVVHEFTIGHPHKKAILIRPPKTIANRKPDSLRDVEVTLSDHLPAKGVRIDFWWKTSVFPVLFSTETTLRFNLFTKDPFNFVNYIYPPGMFFYF